jgi:hypothetical protein
MAPPPCSLCGSLENACLSERLRRQWAGEEGVKWKWRGGLAYWRLCLDCHREVWPEDRRNRNGFSLPFSALCDRTILSGRSGGKVSLVVGDFWLTHPPPELLRPGVGPRPCYLPGGGQRPRLLLPLGWWDAPSVFASQTASRANTQPTSQAASKPADQPANQPTR